MNWCIIHLDDIIIYSKDPASHLVRLEAMIQNLDATRLKLKPSKCKLFHKQITYLGPIIYTQEIATDPKKTKVIKKWPTPTTITEVGSFIGFTDYYCHLILQFTQIGWPLHTLTAGKNASRKKVSNHWMNGCHWSFEELKWQCTAVPVFAYTDFDKLFNLHTDACGF